MKLQNVIAIVMLVFLVGCSGDSYYENLPSEGNQEIIINQGSNTAILLIHGLRATPWELKGLAEELGNQDYDVYAPVIIGHALSPSELEHTTWEEWYQTVNQSYSELQLNYEKIFVVGISTGGSLGLQLAKEHELTGVVSIATPVHFQNKFARTANYLKYFVKYVPRSVRPGEEGHYYIWMPSRSVAELNQLTVNSLLSVNTIDEPILVIQSRDDETVVPSSAQELFDRLTTENKKLLWIDGVSHTVLNDGDNTAQEAIIEFIKEN